MARIVIIAGLTLICAASDAEARYRNRVQQCIETGTELQPVCGMGAPVVSAPFPGRAIVIAERSTGNVRALSGATAHVAASAAGSFQCIVDRLERQGYPIRFMGGWRARGSLRGSLHRAGLAIDINQTGRNRTIPRMPSNEVEIANSCGAISGAQWGHRDSGHFQIGGWTGWGQNYARRHQARYANQ
jgi:hypothetical protein